MEAIEAEGSSGIGLVESAFPYVHFVRHRRRTIWSFFLTPKKKSIGRRRTCYLVGV